MQFTADEFGSGFSLSSKGEEVYIFSTNSLSEITGFVHGFSYDYLDTSLTIGRYISQHKEQFVIFKKSSFNDTNASPLIGPIVFNSIRYKSFENGIEYIQLININGDNVHLYNLKNPENTWKIDGIDFEFPRNITVNAGDAIYLINENITIAEFKSLKNLNNDDLVFNYNGNLANEGERLAILKPCDPYKNNGETIIPYMLIDETDYNNKNPWPVIENAVFSITKIYPDLYSNNPENWVAEIDSFKIENDLPPGYQNAYYITKLKSTGYIGEYSWNVDKETLPAGLEFNAQTIQIYGIPTEQGSFSIKVEVINKIDTFVQFLNFIIHANNSPIAQNDTLTVLPYSDSFLDVLLNDFDLDGDKYSWYLKIANKPKNGTVSIDQKSNRVIYKSNKTSPGYDEFSYEVDDGQGKDTASVYLKIQPSNQDDFEALMAFYEATGNDSWITKTGWEDKVNNISNDWHGVRVENGRVVALCPVSNNLGGTMPDEIGLLSDLKYFILGGSVKYHSYENKVSGDIPSSIGNLIKLEDVNFYANGLLSVPSSLNNLQKLKFIDLSENQLEDLPNLTDLKTDQIYVRRNMLTFEDLEPNIELFHVPLFYQEQGASGYFGTLELNIGDRVVLESKIYGGEHNIFTWNQFGNDIIYEPISGPDNSIFIISALTKENFHKYVCNVTNTIIRELSFTGASYYIKEKEKPENINHINSDDIFIYSNLNCIYINFGSIPDNAFIEVYNLLGEQIYVQRLSSLYNKITLHNNEGIYIVKVINGNQLSQKKLLISK